MKKLETSNNLAKATQLLMDAREGVTRETAYHVEIQKLSRRMRDLESANKYLKARLVEAVKYAPSQRDQDNPSEALGEMLTVIHRIDAYFEKLTRNADLEYAMLTALSVVLGKS